MPESPPPLPRVERAALTMLAGWMGERFYRTFQHDDEASDPFDALLTQRGRRVGVTIGLLWEDGDLPGGQEIERLLAGDIEGDGGYVLWVPPGGTLPADEPLRSEFRLLIASGLKGLAPGERRELRIPARLRLAKVDAEGSYVSVSGGMSELWTSISEGVDGAFHLDSTAIRRLPEEPAEAEVLVSRVHDHAAALAVEELSEITVHDYWLVSRLPADEPPGLTVSGASPGFDAADAAGGRRLLRRHVRRASEQRQRGECEFSVLLLLASLAHIEQEMTTAALRGMSPAAYGSLDLIALVGDGRVREVLQPRSLPWESEGGAS